MKKQANSDALSRRSLLRAAAAGIAGAAAARSQTSGLVPGASRPEIIAIA